MLTTQDPNPSAIKPFFLWRPFLALWHWLSPPTQAHVDRQSTTSRWIAAGLIVLACAGLVVVGLMFGRDWHHSYKSWYARSLMKEVRKYEIQADNFYEQKMAMETQQAYATAAAKAQEAYKLDNENVDCVRFWAKVAVRGKQGGQAVYLVNRLKELTPPTDDDVALRIQAYMINSEDKEAATQIEKVFNETKPSPKTAQLADEVLQRMGRAQQLLALLKHFVEQRPDDLDLRLMLGMRLIQLGNEEEAKTGLKTLWELAANDQKVGLQAIEFLDKLKTLNPDDQKRLIDRLEHHPLVKEEHRIAALRHLVLLQPEKKEEIFKQAIDNRRSAKREDLVPLIRWLNEENQSGMVVAFLKQREDQVCEYAPLLENYLNALTKLNLFDDLERIVKDRHTVLTTAERNFHLLHLAYVTKKPEDDLRKLIIDALASALSENKVNMMIQIARYAELRGLLPEAQKAYKAATVHPVTEQPGYEGMMRISYRLGDSSSYLEAAKESAGRWPDNQYFVEQYLYATLISGMELETSLARVKKLLDARPRDSQRKLMMALALYRQQDSREGAAFLQNISLRDLSLGQGAVLCGIMSSAGYNAQAMQIAKQIPDDAKMLPEEERFLQRARVLP